MTCTDGDAQEVLSHVSTVTLAEAHNVLDWICAQAMDDLTHVRPQTDHVVLIHHEGEKEARAVLMPIEAWQSLLQALVKGKSVP